MNSLTRPELSQLEVLLEGKVEEVLKERKAIGLSVPEKYEVNLTYYNHDGALAQAQDLLIDKPGISINLFVACLPHLSEEDCKNVSSLITYFSIMRDFLMNPHEEKILSFLDNPGEELKRFEAHFEPDGLERYRAFLRGRGTSYENFVAMGVKKAPEMKGLLAELLPKFYEVFEKVDLSPLRHEMDHVDFYSSKLWKDYKTALGACEKLAIESKVPLTEAPNPDYACAKMSVLELDSQVRPLLESRAMFFTFIGPGQFNQANMSEVAEKVSVFFGEEYVSRVFPPNILDALVSREWGNGKMDRQTSNCLFYSVLSQMGSPTCIRYQFDETKVNQEVANMVLIDLEKWKDIYRKNARRAAYAIGKAHVEDPKRFALADQQACCPDEYLRICAQSFCLGFHNF